MDQALIPAITALVVAIAGLLTTVRLLVVVLQHGAILTETRAAVNGQADQLNKAIGTMQVENAKRAQESN